MTTFPFAPAAAGASEAPGGRSSPTGAAMRLHIAAPLSDGWIARGGIVSAWSTLALAVALLALRLWG